MHTTFLPAIMETCFALTSTQSQPRGAWWWCVACGCSHLPVLSLSLGRRRKSAVPAKCPEPRSPASRQFLHPSTNAETSRNSLDPNSLSIHLLTKKFKTNMRQKCLKVTIFARPSPEKHPCPPEARSDGGSFGSRLPDFCFPPAFHASAKLGSLVGTLSLPQKWHLLTVTKKDLWLLTKRSKEEHHQQFLGHPAADSWESSPGETAKWESTSKYHHFD